MVPGLEHDRLSSLFLEILVGFPIHLETDSGPIENLRTQKETEEIQQSAVRDTILDFIKNAERGIIKGID